MSELKRTYQVLVAFLAIVLVVVPVIAAPPLGVHIEVEKLFLPGSDPFVASGPAVGAGVVCAQGLVEDLEVRTSGPPAGSFRRLRVLKQFTCDDASEIFDVRLVVRLDLTTNETTANWKFVGGTGSYTSLRGNGKLVGIPIVPGVSILDLYNGKVH
jgi:hypothetical protein